MPLPETRLVIRLTPGAIRATPGLCSINEVRGGPETLLHWLELKLGLPALAPHRANCVTEYASAIDAVLKANSQLSSVIQTSIDPSMRNDRWATASDLLARRDELALGGWDPDTYAGNDPLVQVLGAIAKQRPLVFLSIADRLKNIVEALDGGQQLPEHRCELADSIDQWPVAWQKVLQRLNTSLPRTSPPQATPGTTLRSIQDAFISPSAIQLPLDESIRCVQAMSQTAAVECIAAYLASNPNRLSRTVIVCEDSYLAMQLDACLARFGLPTMGAGVRSTAHPILQVLPLVLALCWEPVDPQRLLDLLTLPFSPIPKKAASSLANALSAEPGLGSGSWHAAIDALCTEELDPDGEVRTELDLWLHAPRYRHDGRVPTSYVKERCSLVAQWAQKQAIRYTQEDEDKNLELIQAFRLVSSEASLLGEIAECQGNSLTNPQLLRLLEEALGQGAESTGQPALAGGPLLVSSLAGVMDPCYRVIWLGVGTGDSRQSTWNAEQRDALKSSGILLDDGAPALKSLRAAEARGLLQIENSMLAIVLPSDREKRWHPIWLAVQSHLNPVQIKQIPWIEDLIQENQVETIQPFTFSTEAKPVVPPQPLRTVWKVPPNLLKDVDTVSASELEERLACPLRWTFRNNAKLYHGNIAQLPNDFQLKGTFCHRILEYAFGDGGELPSVEEAVAKVEEIFDARIERDAAPLAQPERYRERQLLREQLANATQVLISNLAAGGYRIVGMEVPVDGTALGRNARGSIDCLIQNDAGQEGIIDFKFSGKRYGDLIREGRCVQLAMYANNRNSKSHRYPEVAYLILDRSELITHQEAPIAGASDCTQVTGPTIHQVWSEFQAAITNAEDWLTTHGEIPARPLQTTDLLPKGAHIVLDVNLKDNEPQRICKYCDYQQLCGVGGLE